MPYLAILCLMLTACFPLPFSSSGSDDLGTVEPPASPEWHAYVGGGTPAAIPDANPLGIMADVYVPYSSEVILDAWIKITISHTYFYDLDITLESPHGQKVNLIFSQLFSGTWELTWFVGDIFDGESIGGLWKLSIKDTAPFDTGSLLSWQILLLQGVPLMAPASPADAGLVQPGQTLAQGEPVLRDLPFTILDQGTGISGNRGPDLLAPDMGDQTLAKDRGVVAPLSSLADQEQALWGHPGRRLDFDLGVLEPRLCSSTTLANDGRLLTGTSSSPASPGHAAIWSIRIGENEELEGATRWDLPSSGEGLEFVLATPDGSTLLRSAAEGPLGASLESRLYYLEANTGTLWMCLDTPADLEGIRAVATPGQGIGWTIMTWGSSEQGDPGKSCLQPPFGASPPGWSTIYAAAELGTGVRLP